MKRQIPTLHDALERQQSIINNTPAIFDIVDNPQANQNYADNYAVHEMGALAVSTYGTVIEQEALNQGVDPNLVRSIMYLENAQGGYLGISQTADTLHISSSRLPMNINPTIWGALVPNADFNDPVTNIRAGVILIQRIKDRLLPEDQTIAKIASIYQFTGQNIVVNYGARTESIYSNQLWASPIQPNVYQYETARSAYDRLRFISEGGYAYINTSANGGQLFRITNGIPEKIPYPTPDPNADNPDFYSTDIGSTFLISTESQNSSAVYFTNSVELENDIISRIGKYLSKLVSPVQGINADKVTTMLSNSLNRYEFQRGTTGNDDIYALQGNNTIFSLEGDDQISVNQGQGIYDGGEGTDTLSYINMPEGIDIDLGVGNTYFASQIQNGLPTGQPKDVFASIENVIGSPFDDTITGGKNTTFLEGGGGNDLLGDFEQNHSTQYRFSANQGHDIIDDSDRLGEVQINGKPVRGAVKADVNNPGVRWISDYDNKDNFILTRTNAGMMSASGSDLTITVDEAAEGAQNSITVKNYPFAGQSLPSSMGLGVRVNPELANSDNLTGNQAYPSICKIDANRIAETWFDAQTNRVNGRIYSLTPKGGGDFSLTNETPFTIPLQRYPGVFTPSISAMGTDKIVVGYMDYSKPLDPTKPDFLAVKAAVIGTDGMIQKTVDANNFAIDNINSPAVVGIDDTFIVGFQYGFAGHITPPTGEIRQYNLNGDVVGNIVTKPVISHFSGDKRPQFSLTKMADAKIMYVWTGDPVNFRSQLKGQVFSTSDLASVSNEILLFDGQLNTPVATTLIDNGNLGEDVVVVAENLSISAIRISGSNYSVSPRSILTTTGDNPTVVSRQNGGYTTAWNDNRSLKAYIFDADDSIVGANTASPRSSVPLTTSSNYLFSPSIVEVFGDDKTCTLASIWQASQLSTGTDSDIYTSIISVPLPSKTLQNPALYTNQADDLRLGQDSSYANTLGGQDHITLASNNSNVRGGLDKDVFTVEDISSTSVTRQVSQRVNTIEDFDPDLPELIQLPESYGFTSFSDIPITQNGTDTLLQLSGSDTLILENVSPWQLNATHFQFLPDTVPTGIPQPTDIGGVISNHHGANNAALGALVLLGLPLAVLGGAAYYYREPIKEKSSQAWNWLSSTAKSCWNYMGFTGIAVQSQQQGEEFAQQKLDEHELEIIVEGGEKEENALPLVVETVTKKTPTLPEKKPAVLKSAPPLPEKLSSQKSIVLEQQLENEIHQLEGEVHDYQAIENMTETHASPWKNRIPKSSSMDFSELTKAKGGQQNTDTLQRSASFSELLNRKQEFMSQQL